MLKLMFSFLLISSSAQACELCTLEIYNLWIEVEIKRLEKNSSYVQGMEQGILEALLIVKNNHPFIDPLD